MMDKPNPVDSLHTLLYVDPYVHLPLLNFFSHSSFILFPSVFLLISIFFIPPAVLTLCLSLHSGLLALDIDYWKSHALLNKNLNQKHSWRIIARCHSVSVLLRIVLKSTSVCSLISKTKFSWVCHLKSWWITPCSSQVHLPNILIVDFLLLIEKEI